MENFLQIVRKAKKGDAGAFALLYDEIYKDMYKFALYTLRNTSDAEDMVSETVMDAFESIKKLRREEAFRDWIFRILSNIGSSNSYLYDRYIRYMPFGPC